MVTLFLAATACVGSDEPSNPIAETGEGIDPTSTGEVIPMGGILREETTDFGFTGAFDPTGEYDGSAWALYGNFLMRGLVSYPWLPADQGGNEPVADLATDTGQVSEDGLTWTFTLKEGIMWQAPLSRAVTAQDVAFAFQRINTETLIAQYGNYYCGTIVGMDCAGEDQTAPIEGIETPDAQTIVFHLEQPTGDLLYRLAQPAAAPMPPEVAGCFPAAGEYGRFVMSNGPYMLLGSDAMDISSCDTLEPISGYDPDAHMYFVRNDAYDQSTDDNRLNYIDGFAYTINTNVEDIYSRVLNGDIDIAHGPPPAAILQQYLTNPDLEDNLRTDPGDRTYYITMNLLVPPFDDVNVRKAVNFVVDKASLLQATGGPTTGEVATTIEPPAVLPETAEYDPYPSPDFAGDIEAAKAAMAASRYDSDGDGVCDDPVCDNVLFVNRNYEPWTLYSPIMTQSLAEIGIDLQARELEESTSFATVLTMNRLVPIAINTVWGKDYASPYGFDFFLFNTAGLACEGSFNTANVGISAEQAEECGSEVAAAYEAAVDANGEIPSVDEDMAACVATPPGPEYNACWVTLDTRIMEEIVPWVPYRWDHTTTVLADSVAAWSYDQSASWTAYSRTAVTNGLTMDDVAA